MAPSAPPEPTKQNHIYPAGRQLEERAAAIGRKVAPLLDPSSIAASLDTLATAAFQLQNAEPDVSEGLHGLAAILHAARNSQSNHTSLSSTVNPLHLPKFQEARAAEQSSASPLHPSLQDTPHQLHNNLAPSAGLGGPSASRPTRAAAKKTRARPKSDNIILDEGVDFVEFDPKRRLTCHICHKGFPKPYDLTRHIRSHTGEKPFVCEVEGCGKGFVQKSALVVHLRVHTGERPYKCEYPGCADAFGDVSALTRHRRRHGVNNYSYKCPQPGCLRAFTRKAALMAHERRTHSGSPNVDDGSQAGENEGFNPSKGLGEREEREQREGESDGIESE